MTLHIFNPDHDIALASGLENFTAPHAGRQLRHDLGWLPALWACEGDQIWVDDAEKALTGMNRFFGKLHISPHVELVTNPPVNIPSLNIAPWGWDSALRRRLLRKGIDEQLLPTPESINTIRQLSHRHTAAQLLNALCTQIEGTTGEVFECRQPDEIDERIKTWQKVVVKAPWSSSGRGVRFIDGEPSPSVQGWLRNTLSIQGSVMVEPQYEKIKDFAFEFIADGKGHITFQGLSLFHTTNGAYTGNLLATEDYKRQQLCHYLPDTLLRQVEQAICQLLAPTIGANYTGPFGIDMMVIANSQGYLMHPCVEINLRHTMGHAALALTRFVNPQADNGLIRVMRIAFENNQYKLKLQHL